MSVMTCDQKMLIIKYLKDYDILFNFYSSCEHCGKKFIDKQAFRNHKERVHQITDKQNYCKKCKIGYAQVHNCLNNKKNTSCPYRGCKKQFQTKQGLQLHIKRDHENNR